MFMRKLTLTLGLALMLVAGTSFADDRSFEPVLRSIKPENVFVPTGFDNNDNSQIVLAGNYANTCYKVGPTSASVDHDKRRITVDSQAYFFDGCFCAMVLVPYTKTIDLGILTAGQYDIFVQSEAGETQKTGVLNVATSAGKGQDDYYYAPVSEAFLENYPTESGDVTLVLRGTFTNTCMRIKEVKMIQNVPNVYEVLPIMTDNGDELNAPGCKPTSESFTERVTVKSAAKGKALFHVRALSGKAVNVVGDLF